MALAMACQMNETRTNNANTQNKQVNQILKQLIIKHIITYYVQIFTIIITLAHHYYQIYCVLMKNTTFIFYILLALASAKYRIDQNYSTPNVIQQMVVLPDKSLAVGHSNVIQILTGTDYQTIKQEIQTKSLISDIFLSQINGSLVFLQQGTINSVGEKQQDQNKDFTYKSIDYQTEMKRWKDTIIVPPLDIQNTALIINVTNFNISVVTTSDSYSLVDKPLSSSNIDSDDFSNYYFVTVDENQAGLLYSGNNNNFTNIYNFTDRIDYYMMPERSIASLQIFNVGGQKYIGLAWQPEANLQYQYDLIRQINDSKFENYSSIIVIKEAKTAKYIDYDSILVYDISCQIVQVNPINPMALNQNVTGIQSVILIGSISQHQNMFLGLQTNVKTNDFYGYSYIYSLNQKGQFVIKTAVKNSVTGFAFGSSCFLLNDSYLAVLQLQTKAQTKAQLSLYSLLDQSFKEDSRITDVYNIGTMGYFCSCQNSSHLFVIKKQSAKNFTLNLYDLQNDSLVLKDYKAFNILVAPMFPQTYPISNFSCVGEDSFVIMQSFPKNFTMTMFSVNDNDTIEQVSSILELVQMKHQLAAVMENVLVVSPASLNSYKNSPFLFYDWDLNSVNLSLSNSQIIYTTRILAFQNNDILLQKSDNSLQLWSLFNEEFLYSGGFPSKIFVKSSKSMVSYSRLMFLPVQNTLYIEYSGKPQNTAYNYKLNHPARNRLGQVLDKDNSCPNFEFQQFITTGNGNSFIGYNSKSNSIVKYLIWEDSVSLIDSITIDIKLAYMRLSSDNQWLILWGFDLLANTTRLQIRNFTNFAKVKYDRIFSSFVNETIYDCDYTKTDQVFLTTKKDKITLKIYLFHNNEQIIESSQLLSSVTIFAAGAKSVAYSGIDTSSGVQATYFLFHPIDSVENAKLVKVGCTIKLLEFSSSENSIIGVCLNDTLFNYILSRNQTNYFPLDGVPTKISFLNDSFIAITLDGKIITKDLQVSSLLNYSKQIITATANSSLAIDYNNQLMAFSSNSTNIIITDFDGNIVDEVQAPTGESVVSLAFNLNDELLVSTDKSSLLIWTSLPCPQNFTLNNQICECSPTFVPIGISCQCPNNLVIINASCGCSNTFIEQNQTCTCLNNLVVIDGICSCPSSFVLIDGFCSCPNNLVLIDGVCSCLNNLIVIDGFCSCLNNLVVIDGFCSCLNNLVVIDGFCSCLSNLVVIDGFCSCSNSFVLIDGFCSCPNNLVVINDFCSCPSNLVLIDGVCSCFNNLVLINGICSCPQSFVLTSGFCQCSGGFIQESNKCQQCSFMCQSCLSSDLLNCQTFGVWFYVIVGGLVLIIAGIIAAIVLKIRKNKKIRGMQLSEPLTDDSKSKDASEYHK